MQQLTRRANAYWRKTAADLEIMVTPVPGRFSVIRTRTTPCPPDIPPHGVAGGGGTESTLAATQLDRCACSCKTS